MVYGHRLCHFAPHNKYCALQVRHKQLDVVLLTGDGGGGGGGGEQPLSILFPIQKRNRKGEWLLGAGGVEGRYSTKLLEDFSRERDMIGKVNDHF